MKFCSNCGAELKDGQLFCSKCGSKLEINNVNNNDDKTEEIEVIEQDLPRIPIEQAVPEIQKSSFKFDLKAKVVSCVIFVLIATAIGFYVIGNTLTKPDVVVDKFKSAVTSNNKSELESILFCDDSELSINDGNTSLLLKYFKSNPSNLNSIVSNLNKQAAVASEIKNFQNDSSQTFNIELVGKKYLFFPEYKINIQPSFIEIKASTKDIKFTLDNKEIGKSDSDNFKKKYGPFMPIGHTLLADYKGKYVSLSKSYDVSLDKGSHEESIEVLNDLKYINIDSDNPEAEIFVNNKDTGVKVAEASNFGPVGKNTQIYGVVQKDGAKLRSNNYNVSDEDRIYLDFGDAENELDDVQDKVKNLVYGYTNAFTQAVNSNDISQIGSYVYPGSDLYNEQAKYIPSTYEKGIKEYLRTCNVVSVNVNDDNKSGTVTTSEVYDIEDSSGNITTKSFDYKYTFKYNDSINSYQLTGIANTQ
ncbi:zinc ribbon domain-containing protein [Clostridium neuense]|uniref:Membrane-associated protein TcaA n=1 Tax=Clostridium neuense TaxID=1728934 RepID=A0ABW8THY8_9CLOT